MAYGQQDVRIIPSRYERTSRAELYDGTGIGLTMTKRHTYITGTPTRTLEHVIAISDTFPDLALRYYQDPNLWHYIADMNLFVPFPGDLGKHVGEVLTLLTPDTVRSMK